MADKISKGEKICVKYFKSNGEQVFVLTSKANSDYFFLYEVNPDGSMKKLGKSRSPTELEEKFGVVV